MATKRKYSKRLTPYNSYLKQRKQWESKGYALDAKMTKKEFEMNYKLAQDAKMKNIARTFAHSDIMFTATESREIYKEIQKSGSTFLQQKINNPLWLSKHAKDRATVFDWLADHYGYRDAEAIMY